MAIVEADLAALIPADLGPTVTRAQFVQLLMDVFHTIATEQNTGVVPVSSKSVSYTLAAADNGSILEFTSGTAVNCTVPPSSSVTFPTGTTIGIDQIGAGQVSIVAGAGVTIHTASSLTTRAQYSSATLRMRATDDWIVAGDLT
jgi:hypothetical protein